MRGADSSQNEIVRIRTLFCRLLSSASLQPLTLNVGRWAKTNILPYSFATNMIFHENEICFIEQRIVIDEDLVFMFCIKCGKEILENANFCSNCGTPVPKASLVGGDIVAVGGSTVYQAGTIIIDSKPSAQEPPQRHRIFCYKCGAGIGESNPCITPDGHSFADIPTGKYVFCYQCGKAPGKPEKCINTNGHSFVDENINTKVFCYLCGKTPGNVSRCTNENGHSFAPIP